jgi:hypothetical protein
MVGDEHLHTVVPGLAKREPGTHGRSLFVASGFGPSGRPGMTGEN